MNLTKEQKEYIIEICENQFKVEYIYALDFLYDEFPDIDLKEAFEFIQGLRLVDISCNVDER